MGDLGCPAGDGPAQFVDLGRAGFVLEVVSELESVAEREDRFVDPVDVSDGFLSVPGGADFAVGSPASRRPRSRVRPRSLMRSWAAVRRRRIR